MHEITGFVATLTLIAGEPCSGEERSSRAAALVKSYSAALYARLGILASNRPTTSAKSTADQTLAALRSQILAVETRSTEPSRTAYTAARHGIEMARRVLAGRLVEGGAQPAILSERTIAQLQPHADSLCLLAAGAAISSP